MRTRLFTVIIMAMIGTVGLAHAELKTYGKFETMQIDVTNFPPKMKEAYALYAVKCAKCHRLDRSIITLKTGITPSGVEFDNAAIDAYALKMLRKPDSNMSKREVSIVTGLLKYMRQVATSK